MSVLSLLACGESKGIGRNISMIDTTIERYKKVVADEHRVQNIVIVGFVILLIVLFVSSMGCMGIQAPVGMTGMPKLDIPIQKPPNNFYDPKATPAPTPTPISNITTTTTKPRFVYV